MVCLNCGCEVGLGVKFCTHCGKPTSLADDNNTGVVNITRKNTFFACLIPFEVYIDDSKFTDLKNGETINCKLAVGNHEVKIKTIDKAVTQNITISETQKEATIEVKPKMGLLTARPCITNVEYK